MSREEILNNMKADDIVAFKTGDKMLSAKVIQIEAETKVNSKGEEYDVVIETKNGSCYYVKKTDIVWVKKEDRWPNSIFMALKKKELKQDERTED